MSLINQMLQDLEKRGEDESSHAATHYLQAGVAAPGSRFAMTSWLLGLFVLVLVGAVLAVVLWIVRAKQNADLTAKASSNGQSTRNAPLAVTGIQSQPPSAGVREFGLTLSLQLNTASLSKKSIASSIPNTSKTETLESQKQVKPAQHQLAEPAVITVGSISAKATDAEPSQGANRAGDKPVVMIKEVSVQQRAETEYRQANIYQQQGRANEAVLALENALKLDPLHASARQLLISLLLENKRHEEAIRELKQGLTVDPTQLNFSMLLARLLVERAKLNDAIDILQKNLNLAQDRPDYLAFLAALQQKTGHHQDAVQLYRQALKKHAQNGVWWMGLGISLQAEGKASEAIEAYQQAKQQSGLSAELLAFVEQKIMQLHN